MRLGIVEAEVREIQASVSCIFRILFNLSYSLATETANSCRRISIKPRINFNAKKANYLCDMETHKLSISFQPVIESLEDWRSSEL